MQTVKTTLKEIPIPDAADNADEETEKTDEGVASLVIELLSVHPEFHGEFIGLLI